MKTTSMTTVAAMLALALVMCMGVQAQDMPGGVDGGDGDGGDDRYETEWADAEREYQIEGVGADTLRLESQSQVPDPATGEEIEEELRYEIKAEDGSDLRFRIRYDRASEVEQKFRLRITEVFSFTDSGNDGWQPNSGDSKSNRYVLKDDSARYDRFAEVTRANDPVREFVVGTSDGAVRANVYISPTLTNLGAVELAPVDLKFDLTINTTALPTQPFVAAGDKLAIACSFESRSDIDVDYDEGEDATATPVDGAVIAGDVGLTWEPEVLVNGVSTPVLSSQPEPSVDDSGDADEDEETRDIVFTVDALGADGIIFWDPIVSPNADSATVPSAASSVFGGVVHGAVALLAAFAIAAAC